MSATRVKATTTAGENEEPEPESGSSKKNRTDSEVGQTDTGSQKKTAKKFPCGKCDKEVKANDKAVFCGSCECWLHYGCVKGMTKEYFDNCQKTYKIIGQSAFLCKICRKIATKHESPAWLVCWILIQVKNVDANF